MIYTSRSYISNRHLLQSIKDLCCFRMVFMCHDIPPGGGVEMWVFIGGGDWRLGWEKRVQESVCLSGIRGWVRHIKIYISFSSLYLSGLSRKVAVFLVLMEKHICLSDKKIWRFWVCYNKDFSLLLFISKNWNSMRFANALQYGLGVLNSFSL